MYKCTKCNTEKDEKEFYPSLVKKSTFVCKSCRNIWLIDYRKKRPDISKKCEKNFSKKHYGRICPYCKEKFWKVSSSSECSTKCKLLNRIQKDEKGCWNWKAECDSTGYGRISIDGIRKQSHRASYEFFKGEIPDGKILLHQCDNRRCCNPEHLQIGSVRENNFDRCKKDRTNLYNPNRINENDVRMIKDMKKRGLSVQEIKKAIGKCSLVHIRNILRGDAWAHVE